MHREINRKNETKEEKRAWVNETKQGKERRREKSEQQRRWRQRAAALIMSTHHEMIVKEKGGDWIETMAGFVI